MVSVLRPGQRILTIPGIGAQTSRRAVGAVGNGLLNSLIAYWPLNEAAGANDALDLHTNGLTLTQVDSPGADIGKVFSTARTFDGHEDYFTRTSEALLRIGDIDFTAAVWVFPIGLDTIKVITGKRSTGVYEWQLIYYDLSGFWNFGASSDGGVGAGLHGVGAANFGTAQTNAWQLLIVSHDAAADLLSISVNAGVPNTAAHAGGIYALDAPFQLGYYAGGFPFRGRIGPVAMWKSAAGGGGVLSSSQRSALWNAGNGLAYANFTT